jgi:hypothetical protein
MKNRLEIAKNWLPRYTGVPLDQFGDYVLLTNFHYYVTHFATKFGCEICGEGRPMRAATNSSGLSIVNFGIGSANAATVMDLMSARHPKESYPGQMRRLKTPTDIGHFGSTNCASNIPRVTWRIPHDRAQAVQTVCDIGRSIGVQPVRSAWFCRAECCCSEFRHMARSYSP